MTLDPLIQIDQAWLVAINGWHAPWADTLMWYVSKSTTWLPLYALLVGLIVYRYGFRLRRQTALEPWRCWAMVGLIFVGFGVAVGLSDFISSGLIKPWIARPRPTHEPALEGMLHIVRGYRGGAYGFVSSHAANTMACGLLFSLIWKNWKATVGLMSWVALNCYSRMYLGVHYPGDIIGGLLIGSLLALLTYRALRRAARSVLHRSLAACGSTAAADDADHASGGS